MSEYDDATIVAVATALLKAAILNVDIASSMPLSVQAKMPEDISARLYSHEYQSAFDSLPESVKVAAQANAEADPHIIAAKAIDRGEGRP